MRIRVWHAALTVQGKPGEQGRVGLRPEVVLSMAAFQVIMKIYLLRLEDRTYFS